MTVISKPMLVNPKIQIPQWDSLDDPTAAIHSFYLTNNPCVFNIDSPTTIHRYLTAATDFEDDVDTFSSSSDHFRMFEFKVRTCTRGRSHDWTKCPYAHPGEKARRRDPRMFKYSGTECPESRNGNGSCRKGDSCGFSHGVFESWLHPDRYRTQPCRDGISCCRRVCFFAHTSEQLRIPLSNSPPMSPNSPRIGDELVSLMNNLQLRARRISSLGSAINSESCGFGVFGGGEEEPAMERVESGRDLRARMYAKLMRENSLERVRSYQPMISDGFWS